MLEIYKPPNYFGDSPQPRQIEALKNCLFSMAQEQGKVKKSRYTERASTYVTPTVEDFSCRSLAYAVKVQREGHGDYKIWNMRLKERIWIADLEQSDSYKTIYTFRWDSDEVYTARRSIESVSTNSELNPVTRETSLQDLNYIPDIPDILYDSELMAMYANYSQVSQADCDFLHHNIESFLGTAVRF